MDSGIGGCAPRTPKSRLRAPPSSGGSPVKTPSGLVDGRSSASAAAALTVDAPIKMPQSAACTAGIGADAIVLGHRGDDRRPQSSAGPATRIACPTLRKCSGVSSKSVKLHAVEARTLNVSEQRTLLGHEASTIEACRSNSIRSPPFHLFSQTPRCQLRSATPPPAGASATAIPATPQTEGLAVEGLAR